jgi:hypothetical protein
MFTGCGGAFCNHRQNIVCGGDDDDIHVGAHYRCFPVRHNLGARMLCRKCGGALLLSIATNSQETRA